ncbi:MAG: CoA pyrophosphatase [Dokdonella sp.]|jgi:8-oxo-dGTP pyrophosphatase MutT (NUDIX family)|uniref:CoA pyrophosphatase n=1 Tax=Dokdonella sp. TaxID=2291710 RepID=UPI002BB66893|nr:CoA pyrophosphatase [Dokdonella sp.]HNV07630.1 CoA pyrophosphatase [Dokdonella sp.]HPW03009.1 CoA pyrophosphatase [Dokdonella sp.]HQV50092.1 CoA pyrophosphatase [Dokdonella sp.]HQX32153.1 CoA pyrophosphatase [Dokdonella sp.]
MSEHLDIGRLRRAVRPLQDPPQPPGWNASDFPELWSDRPALRQAAVLLPVVCRNDALSMLFTRRNESMRQHAGQVSFPGGAVESGDSDAIATALRETREETGIDAGFITPLGFLDCFDTISGFCVSPVVALVREGFAVAPDPREVAEVFEVPLDYILEPDRMQRSEILWHGRGREIFEFDYAGKRIWGATAAILQNLLRRLEALA